MDSATSGGPGAGAGAGADAGGGAADEAAATGGGGGMGMTAAESSLYMERKETRQNESDVKRKKSVLEVGLVGSRTRAPSVCPFS